MSWMAFLAVALVIAVVAAITGIKPKGSKPVARTRLMAMARVALVVMALIVAAFAARGWMHR